MNELDHLPIPLLEWYHEHARVLPWRSEPAPYRVLVSEIMLQQTRVAAVLAYFERFMQALPTVEALAEVPEEQLMKLWQGLGYYNRARNLQQAARQIVGEYDGVFPSTYEGLLSLAGVGDYTAGAVGSIAFGIPVPAVDGNVLRVVSRITGDDGDIGTAETKARMRAALMAVLPRHSAGDFNQALMELGATVCLPNGAPLCIRCPVATLCRANREERTDSLPVKAPRKARRMEDRTVFLLFRGQTVALRKRPAKGLLAGLWEYPNELGNEQDLFTQWGICADHMAHAGTGKHVFTHVEWHMQLMVAQVEAEELPSGWVWADRKALNEIYAVPNAFGVCAHLLEQRL